ncbi:MAG: hypothetical protein GXP55_24290 [Deltaproteobacteria bacterium]|nr:hypothetical protein [Deltaproteobacteria bacterium]
MRRSQVNVLMIVLATALAGCTADNASVFIEGDVIPEIQDVGCDVTVDGTLLTSGVYNIDLAAPYSIFPVYANQLLSRATDIRADPNGVQIMGAEIELQDQGGTPLDFPTLPNPFSIPTSTYVPSGDVGEPGRAVGELQIIPEVYRVSMPAEVRRAVILVSVKVFGRTNGNIDIQSGVWQWPVQLCGDGCLFECLGLDGTEVVSCQPGQDFLTSVKRSIPGVITCAATAP